MMETVWRTTVREGYAVLLIAETVRELPAEFARLCDFTVRQGQLLFRAALEREGERARAEYLAAEDNRARARWRVRRLRLEEVAARLDDAHLRVHCTVMLDGDVLQTAEWIWNTDEETLLPPAQCRPFRRRMANHAGLRQKINKFYVKNRVTPLAKAGEM